MKTLLLALALFIPSAFASAQEADLPLPDARFLAKFDRFICNDFAEPAIQLPASLASRQPTVEKLVADGMLINFLVTATFKEGDATCRYSTLLLRARRNNLARIESKAFAEDSAVDCSAGKAELDLAFTKMPFSYTTDPIRFIALKIPAADAATVCGESATTLKMVFERVRK